MKPVCIIGGGFTGLAAARQLARAGLPVILLEKDEQLGGLAASFRVGTRTVEKFYHHWFTTDQYIMDLVKSLRCEDQVEFRDTHTGIYHAQRFFKLTSPLDLFRMRALSVSGRARLGFALLFARGLRDWRALEGTTAREWLLRMCGPEVYRVIWEPLLIGKFGNLASEVSAVWFWNKLKLRGASRGRAGREKLAYFRGGLSALTQAIAADILANGARIRTQSEVVGLEVDHGSLVAVHTTGGKIDASAVILTTPLPIAADLLEHHVPRDYASRLRRIRHLSNVCLVLELKRSLSSIYWLNVNDPSFPFVGVIEHTNFQPPDTYGGSHLVYLSKYLMPTHPFYQRSDEKILETGVLALRRMFPALTCDWIRRFHVWRADHAQPIIERNYGSLIPEMETPISNVFLATMAQVYPEDRGTNYAVRGGLQAARRVQDFLKAARPQ